MGFVGVATEGEEAEDEKGGEEDEEGSDLAAAVAVTLEVLSSDAESNNRERLATPAFRSGVVRLLRMHGGHRRAVLSCMKSMLASELASRL